MLNHFLYRYSSPSLHFSRTFSATIFVKGISFSSTEETFTQAFSQYGRVLREEAGKALLELNGQWVDGRVAILDKAKAGNHNQPDSRPKHAGGDS